jgi:hypothetical protein
VVGVGGTHRWLPVTAIRDYTPSGRPMGFMVVEVCQACQQYVMVSYARWHPAPEVTG